MPDVIIENPVLNSPFAEPSQHFKFDEDGITDKIELSRRTSIYFSPIKGARKRASQLELANEWTADRIQENKLVNRIRERVSAWRHGKYAGITNTSRRLLEYWINPEL